MSNRADRWRPVRAGIVNLYEYGDQVFDLAGGRLLLRGHNTSGKTKALELLLPFCLDGDISPRKLDPFASSAKEMHWNLVGCGDDEQRTGYVWLEFERLAADAGPARLTVGIGLKANRSSRDVRRWYFVVRNRRAGDDLHLMRHDREPVSRAELTARIGDDGEVLDTQSEYRRRLNDLLFGFEDDDRYRTMLQLMLELRRPHLSKTLNPDQVAALLSAGLPVVDEALMRRLAGGLEQLDALEQALVRLRTTSARLQEFHSRAYRGYLRAVVRERGERVRGAHSRVDAAADAVRAADAARAEAETAAARVASEREAAEVAVVRLEGELQAIVGSAAWSGISEVEALRQRAEAQARVATAREESATEAATGAAVAGAERIAATAAAQDARTRAEAGLQELEGLAELAGLRSRSDALATQLRDGSMSRESWAELMRDLARDWRAVLAAHAEHVDRCRRAADRARSARDVQRAAAERVAAARDRVAELDAQLESARDAFAAALGTWRESLVELADAGAAPAGAAPGPAAGGPGTLRAAGDAAHAADVLEPAIEAALARGRDGLDPRPALAAVADGARATIGAARATALAEARAVAGERAALAARIAAIEAERDDGPPPPSLPRSPRDGRPGAPLWRLIDFRDQVGDCDRAGIEAALEASGLLDAWVTPDGRLLDSDTFDAVLPDGPPAPGPTLVEVVAPSGDAVPVELVGALLARVALRDEPDQELAAVVSPGGAYQLGPLHGLANKPAAEHIGAGARAARRARLIAELRAADRSAGEREAELAGLVAELDARAGALEAELAACPPADAIASARRALEIAESLAARAAAEHDHAAAEARAAADAEVAADAGRREHALGHGLDAGIDAPGLRARSDAAAELAGATSGVASAWSAGVAAVEHAAAAARALADAERRVAERQAIARAERAEADRLVAESGAREAALGDSAAALRARHEHVVDGLRSARDARARLADGERGALRALDALAREATDAGAGHERARGERDVAGARFAALGPIGALELALGPEAPDDAALAAGWHRTRVLEVARAVAEKVRGASSAPGELGQDVMRRVQLLDRELADTDLGAYVVRGDDDLVLVRIKDEAGDRDLGDVLEALRADIAERERLLSAEERRVFGDALVQEIADHLRARIRAVHDRVAAMNAVLARSPTAAGKRVALEWRAVEDDTGARRATIDLLRRAARHYGEEEQRQIVEFFRGRVEQARSSLEDDRADESMANTLTRAFDYRRWFAFGLLEESASGRERLTARRHAVGSGGEQSVLIHLPLFAAAAALYGDSGAPRLVMLDEALSGIDDETRERVLAATVAFDLDLVMTSHELWGTYRSVPSLAVYQLHREQGVRGVHAVPFRWDGEVLHELEQAELPV